MGISEDFIFQRCWLEHWHLDKYAAHSLCMFSKQYRNGSLVVWTWSPSQPKTGQWRQWENYDKMSRSKYASFSITFFTILEFRLRFTTNCGIHYRKRQFFFLHSFELYRNLFWYINKLMEYWKFRNLMIEASSHE